MVKIEYAYDCELDIINIHVPNSAEYRESVRLGIVIYLDFYENRNPCNLEIIDASRIFDVNKRYLDNPQCTVEISISENLIRVSMALVCKFRNQNIRCAFDRGIANEFNVPEMEAIMEA